MFCPNCGAALVENARFCEKCGVPAPVAAAPAAAPVEEPVAAPVEAPAEVPAQEAPAAAPVHEAPAAAPAYEAPAYQQPPVYGAPVYPAAPAKPEQTVKGKVLSIIAMVCALCNIPCCWIPFFSPVLGGAGIILGALGIRDGKKGMAITGIVVGAITALIGLLMTFIVMAAFEANYYY